MIAEVHLLAGLNGSGKTTHARHLEQTLPAVRFSLDEWVLRLHALRFDDQRYPDASDRCRNLIWDLAAQTIRTGSSVVLDWNLWSRQQRTEAARRASELGAPCHLHHVDVPLEVAIERASRRSDPHAHQLEAEAVRHLSTNGGLSARTFQPGVPRSLTMRLLLVIGPPAVGKMTMGRELAALSSFRLFHNHHTIEPLVEIFGYGTPAFETLNYEFRRRVIQEAARRDVDLIFTFVWNLDAPEDLAYVEGLVAPVLEVGGTVATLELSADLTTRLARNRGADRLAAKPTKQDLAWSEENVRQMEGSRLNTDPTGTTADAFVSRHPHLRIETSALTATRTARIALAWLDQLAVPPC